MSTDHPEHFSNLDFLDSMHVFVVFCATYRSCPEAREALFPQEQVLYFFVVPAVVGWMVFPVSLRMRLVLNVIPSLYAQKVSVIAYHHQCEFSLQ